MPMVRLTAFLAAVCLIAGTCRAEAAGWQVISQPQQGEIARQAVDGSAYPRIRIRTTFAAPPPELFSLVNDYDGFPDFVPNVRTSRVVHVDGHTQWIFHHLHLPGPVADRVYLLASSDAGSRPEENFYRVEWHLADRVFPDIDLSAGVQPERLNGHWIIEPGPRPGTARAEYAIHSEPGGLLPAWLVTGMSVRYVQQLVDAIRTRLAQ